MYIICVKYDDINRLAVLLFSYILGVQKYFYNELVEITNSFYKCRINVNAKDCDCF